jgi:hypothetical protein
MTIDPKTGSAPHDCPECGSPAYIPFGLPALCTNRECLFYSEDCWVKHVTELPDDEEGVEFDIGEEDTNPYLNMPQMQDLTAAKGLSLHDYLHGYVHPDPSDDVKAKIKKQLDALDKKIDQIPVPFYLTPDDKNATLSTCQTPETCVACKLVGPSPASTSKDEEASDTRHESLLEYSLRMRLEEHRRTRG